MRKKLLIIGIVIVICLIGGYLFLLKQSTKPIKTPVGPTKIELKLCSKDSDCVIVKPICGNVNCLPSYSSCKGGCGCYEVINKKYKSYWENNNVLCTGERLMCKPCPSPQSVEPRCINNTCTLKYEVITLTTDKTEYKQGEDIKIKLTNLGEEIIKIQKVGTCHVFQVFNSNGVKLSIDEPNCELYETYHFPQFIGPNETQIIDHWNQIIYKNGIREQAPSGMYRAKFKTIYSNEFTIK